MLKCMSLFEVRIRSMGIIVDWYKELNLFITFCCELLFIPICSVVLETEFAIGQLDGQTGALHLSFIF
jgi:hypothetical protein